MSYKFHTKIKSSLSSQIISVAPIAAAVLLLIKHGWLIVIIFLFSSIASLINTLYSNKKSKIRIKEIRVDINKIEIDFAFNKINSLSLRNKEFDLVVENNQIIFNCKKESNVLGIAKKEDMEEPEKWDNLINELTA